ncbi:hypothetical protein [Halobacterium litoreum]|uniref:Outer membrane lipoprotein-sorting protein n=1 Tax=Halobacterium litoreum TaxID=2039234 RepID=A0ABD5NC29_9EURY|nr:hypothetical protein [Halobacterium litoreum]UHH14460.1 hypothetical protein LT972_05540 [Halobacterium litoreum]
MNRQVLAAAVALLAVGSGCLGVAAPNPVDDPTVVTNVERGDWDAVYDAHRRALSDGQSVRVYHESRVNGSVVRTTEFVANRTQRRARSHEWNTRAGNDDELTRFVGPNATYVRQTDIGGGDASLRVGRGEAFQRERSWIQHVELPTRRFLSAYDFEFAGRTDDGYAFRASELSESAPYNFASVGGRLVVDDSGYIRSLRLEHATRDDGRVTAATYTYRVTGVNHATVAVPAWANRTP